MNSKRNRLVKAAGIASATAAVASLSALATTNFLCKVALDREQPERFRKAQNAISGSDADLDFLEKKQKATERLTSHPLESVQITARDGVQLVGHWAAHENPKRIIIAMHGWRSSWTNDFALISEFWEKSGCSVLYAEQRGQGNSGGDYMGFGPIERYDCLSWVQWVSLHCGRDIPVYLAGVSMGAATVLMASGLELPHNVHGIMADCGFTSPLAIWKHVATDNLHLSFQLGSLLANSMYSRKTNEDAAGYSTLEALEHCKVPVLLIHGSDDHFVPVEMAYENYKACAAPQKLLIVPGADHAMSYYVDPVAYEAAMLDFWAKHD